MTDNPSLEQLNAILESNPRDEEALVKRGQLYWSLNQRGKAINDYIAAIKLNPKSKATMLMKQANEILNFFNKDLYNP